MSDSAVLTIRKYADKTGRRVTRYFEVHDEDGVVVGVDKRLVNPDTPGDEHEAWPLDGISFCEPSGDTCEPPALTSISTHKAAEGLAEGWLTATGATPVVRPAGPTMDDWNSTTGDKAGSPHVFVHYDTLTFHTREGDFTYKVTHQPDKYADHTEATYDADIGETDDDTPVTPDIYEAGATRVDHFYVLQLEA